MLNDLSKRDADILRHIIKYCDELEEAFQVFGNNEKTFLTNSVFKNAVSMPVQQIGELTKHLTDDFISDHSEVPWKEIKGMREWFAHNYWGMNPHVIWSTATVDLPPLKRFCINALSEKNDYTVPQ